MRADQIAGIRRLIEFLDDGLEQRQALARELPEVPPAQWDVWLRDHPDAHSEATFSALLSQADDAIWADVAGALAITGFVIRHVDAVAVPPEALLALTVLRSRAWATHARALRAASRMDEALHAVDRAAAIAGGEPVLYGERAELENELAAVRAALDAGDSHRSGPIAELIREIIVWAERHPADALARAERAEAIADALSRDRYSDAEIARARGTARMYRALPLRYLSRYKDALAILDEAVEILEPFETLVFDRALTRFSRAITLQESGDFDEAGRVLAECKPVFEAHGDPRTRLLLAISEVALLYRTGRLEAAREGWLALLPVAREVGDPHALASTHNNLAYTLIDLGELAEAVEHLDEAVRLNERIDFPLMVLRSEARARAGVAQAGADRGGPRPPAARERSFSDGGSDRRGRAVRSGNRGGRAAARPRGGSGDAGAHHRSRLHRRTAEQARDPGARFSERRHCSAEGLGGHGRQRAAVHPGIAYRPGGRIPRDRVTRVDQNTSTSSR